MKKDGIQTRNRKLSAKVSKQPKYHFSGMRNVFHHKKSVTILLSFQSKKKRAGMADFFRNGLDGRWGMGMGEIIIRCICICMYILISFCLRHEQIKYRHCPGMGMGYGSSLPMSGYYHQMGPMSQVKKNSYSKKRFPKPFSCR